jgi:hypothetical protein
MVVGPTDELQNQNNEEKMDHRIDSPLNYVVMENDGENGENDQITDNRIVHQLEMDIFIPFSE